MEQELEAINLTNFDDPKFQKSKYILTSPRSLRACGNVGIKPVELLPRSLSQFSKSQYTPDELKGAALSAVYEEYEKQRKVKLLKARKERQRMIQCEAEMERSETPTLKYQKSDFPEATLSTGQHKTIPAKDQRILNALVMKKERELVGTTTFGTPESKFKHERALVNKEMLDQIRHLSIKTKNLAEETRFKKNKSHVDKEKRFIEEHLRATVEQKDAETEYRLQHQSSMKEEYESWQKEKRRLREMQTRLTAANVSAELEDWRQSVDELNETYMYRALEKNERLMLERKLLLQQRRERKEADHSEAMKRLQEEEKRKRECHVQGIVQKYDKMDQFARDRAEQLSQSLKMSRHTSHLRDSIKGHYQHNLFDEGTLYAKQHSELERRETAATSDPLRHQSTVIFG